MAVVCAQGSIDWDSTDIVGTTKPVDLSGEGFSASEPLKAIFFYTNAQASTVDATASADIKLSVGVGTGTAARGCISTQSDDGVGAAACDRVTRTDCVACYLSTSGADAGRLDLSVFGDDDFTCIVDVVVATDKRVHWIAFGGSDFSVAEVGSFTFTADTATTQDVTVTGFETTPATADQCVIILETTATAGSIAADGKLSIGIAAGVSPTNYMAGIFSDDPADPTDTSSYCLAGEVAAQVSTSQAVNTRSSISAWGADKFVFNRIDADATDRVYVYLAMKGPLFQAGDFTIPTDTTPFSETGFGFTPAGAIFVTCGRAASTSDTATVGAALSIGAAANATDQRVVSIYDEDNVSTTDCDHSVQYGEVALAWTAGGGTLDAAVALDSFESGGMTLHCTNAAGAASKFVWYLAVGPSASTADYTGSSAGVGAASAALVAFGLYAGSSAGTGTPAAALDGATAYAASSAGTCTATGELVLAANFVAAAAGVGAASGEMTALADYAGASAGAGAPSATMTGLADYACTADGTSACSASMDSALELVGGSAGRAIVSAQMVENDPSAMLPRPRMRNIRRVAADHLARRRRGI